MLTTMLSMPIYSVTILEVSSYYTIITTPLASTLSTTSYAKQNTFPHHQQYQRTTRNQYPDDSRYASPSELQPAGTYP